MAYQDIFCDQKLIQGFHVGRDLYVWHCNWYAITPSTKLWKKKHFHNNKIFRYIQIVKLILKYWCIWSWAVEFWHFLIVKKALPKRLVLILADLHPCSAGPQLKSNLIQSMWTMKCSLLCIVARPRPYQSLENKRTKNTSTVPRKKQNKHTFFIRNLSHPSSCMTSNNLKWPAARSKQLKVVSWHK